MPLFERIVAGKNSPNQDLDYTIELAFYLAMRFELATRSVTSPNSENVAPLELQDSLTCEILALPYQKYTFSERKCHEESKLWH